MPRNTGQPPEYELVDIEYRNGWKVRGVDPLKRRWTIADKRFGGASDWDIARWQPVGPTKINSTEGEIAA